MYKMSDMHAPMTDGQLVQFLGIVKKLVKNKKLTNRNMQCLLVSGPKLKEAASRMLDELLEDSGVKMAALKKPPNSQAERVSLGSC